LLQRKDAGAAPRYASGMDITAHTHVADIATTEPATIKVFQRYNLDFCCGGKLPLADVCAQHGIDQAAILNDLRSAVTAPGDPEDWQQASLTSLIAHIQTRYHKPLREELERLSQMLVKVVSRHGDRLPDVLLPLQQTFELMRRELLDHIVTEDAVLFPAIVAIEQGRDVAGLWIGRPIKIMESEHEAAGAALARMRDLTRGYAPPEGACPTFRGLYYGLSEFEREMHVHVHLENNILFPRAARLALHRHSTSLTPERT
jgi:regulator of cell morphogenesis and NO signaling